MIFSMIVAGAIAILVIVIIAKTAVVVPQQSAYVVETLGRYNTTMQAGFHILVPFVQRVSYKHTLKEQAVDIPEQICITRDNVQVGVDGVLYLQVLDAKNASYGITDYMFAISQLAQTTLRSEVGKLDPGSHLRGARLHQLGVGDGTGQGHQRLGHQGFKV